MKKLTKEIVNERIIGRGIELMGDYNGNNIKAEFQCKYGHKWKTRPSSVLGGVSCPECHYDDLRTSVDAINNKLLKRGIQLVGNYHNRKARTEFKCLVCNHIWSCGLDGIMGGSGCIICHNNNKRLSKEIVNARLLKRDITLIGDYVFSYDRAEFKCGKCENKWFTKPNNIMNGDGCPVCAGHGYNTSKPGWLYILTFNGYIKYGITNNLENRLSTHTRKNGEYTIALTKLYEDGTIPQLWERNIKIIFGGRYVTKDICPDGYTETLSRDKLQALLDTII